VTPWVPVEFVEEISDLCPDLSTVVQACCVHELRRARRRPKGNFDPKRASRVGAVRRASCATKQERTST